jgi:hypothetical protein
MMKGIKEEEDDEEDENCDPDLDAVRIKKVKVLLSTRSLPTANNAAGHTDAAAGKFSRQQSLPARRPHPLIRDQCYSKTPRSHGT